MSSGAGMGAGGSGESATVKRREQAVRIRGRTQLVVRHAAPGHRDRFHPIDDGRRRHHFHLRLRCAQCAEEEKDERGAHARHPCGAPFLRSPAPRLIFPQVTSANGNRERFEWIGMRGPSQRASALQLMFGLLQFRDLQTARSVPQIRTTHGKKRPCVVATFLLAHRVQ